MFFWIVNLIRVRHYIKNFLIFLPLFFSGSLFSILNLQQTAIGFVAFCFVSSVVYIINDIQDLENDKKHPLKKMRPLASGKITVRQAKLALGLLAIGVLLISFWLPYSATMILIGYLAINVLYSNGFKNIPLFDVAIIATGFCLRVIFGGLVSGVLLSNWILLTVVFISLFLALGKRRNELSLHGATSREVLGKYTREFLDKNMYVSMTAAIVFYALWATIGAGAPNLVWTVPLVFLLAMRYSLVIERSAHEGDPSDVLLSDRPIQIIGLIFVGILFALIYLGG